MEEAILMAGNQILPALNQRSMSSNKGPEQAKAQEMEPPRPNQDKSPKRKRKLNFKPSVQEPADIFDTASADATREVSMLFSESAQVLRESAAADTSQMEELDGLLNEARQLESFLKEKKKHFMQTLALISDQLKD